MSKQTRRSVSISGELYERLQAYAAANGLKGSWVVESEVRKLLGLEQRPTPGNRQPDNQDKDPIPAATEELDDVDYSNTGQELWETAAERRTRVIREAEERRQQSGTFDPEQIRSKVNKSAHLASRMGRRPFKPGVRSSFKIDFVDQKTGIISEIPVDGQHDI